MPNLRSLRMDMGNAHGWDCAHFQDFLDRLPRLENLQLLFPECCGPRGLPLSATYPNLISLELVAATLTPSDYKPIFSTDLLRRHPKLQRLSLICDFTMDLSDSDLPCLQVLHIDEATLWCNPLLLSATAKRPIRHLRLADVSNLFEPKVFNAVKAAAETLRCLEIEDSMDWTPEDIERLPTLLMTVPDLKELAVFTRYDLVSLSSMLSPV